jgi:hypothetical protein
LSGSGGNGDGRQSGGAGYYEGAAVDRMHGLILMVDEMHQPGGKPSNFLVGVLSVMTRPAPVRCGKSPPGVFDTSGGGAQHALKAQSTQAKGATVPFTSCFYVLRKPEPVCGELKPSFPCPGSDGFLRLTATFFGPLAELLFCVILSHRAICSIKRELRGLEGITSDLFLRKAKAASVGIPD